MIIVLCGINHTPVTRTPVSSTLQGTFIASMGTFHTGPVASGGPSVLGYWQPVRLRQTSGLKTVIAKITSGTEAAANSPLTTFTGYSLNQPPVAVNDAYSLNEDGSRSVLAPGVLVNDSDPDGNPITVKLPVATLPAHGSLSINANGSFTYTPAANFNGTDSFTYRATDGSADSTPATVTFTVNPVPDAPTDLALSPASVPENQVVGTTVGTFTTTDVDRSGDSHTYTFAAGGTDNTSFTILGNQLKTAAVFDFETRSSYSIKVRTTDSTANFFDKTLTVTVTNVNEAPTDILLDNTTVAENQGPGTLVGTLSTADPDAPDSHVYSLVDTATFPDNASFTSSLRPQQVHNQRQLRLRDQEQLHGPGAQHRQRGHPCRWTRPSPSRLPTPTTPPRPLT